MHPHGDTQQKWDMWDCNSWNRDEGVVLEVLYWKMIDKTTKLEKVGTDKSRERTEAEYITWDNKPIRQQHQGMLQSWVVAQQGLPLRNVYLEILDWEMYKAWRVALETIHDSFWEIINTVLLK